MNVRDGGMFGFRNCLSDVMIDLWGSKQLVIALCFRL